MFWSAQCPERGAGLTHTHWDKCTPEWHPGEDSGHLPFQCCHCRALDPAAQATVSWPPPQPTPPEPINVQARMERIMGSWRPKSGRMEDKVEETEMEDIRAEIEHEDATPVEPRMVTGNGPDGVPWGQGRGDLTPRQKRRLQIVVEQQAWLDARSPAYQEWLAARGEAQP